MIEIVIFSSVLFVPNLVFISGLLFKPEYSGELLESVLVPLKTRTFEAPKENLREGFEVRVKHDVTIVIRKRDTNSYFIEVKKGEKWIRRLPFIGKLRFTGDSRWELSLGLDWICVTSAIAIVPTIIFAISVFGVEKVVSSGITALITWLIIVFVSYYLLEKDLESAVEKILLEKEASQELLSRGDQPPQQAQQEINDQTNPRRHHES